MLFAFLFIFFILCLSLNFYVVYFIKEVVIIDGNQLVAGLHIHCFINDCIFITSKNKFFEIFCEILQCVSFQKKWLTLLSQELPTVAFHASMQHSFGKGTLINLLRQFANLHKDRQQVLVPLFNGT